MSKRVEELKELMENVPFGNSQFQIQHFIMSQDTPERKYRNALLQLNEKINALKECSFRRRRLEIDINELEDKIGKESNRFQKERYQIDLDQKQWHLKNEVKLINDCGYEILAYEQILDTLPKCTREQFEKAEVGYWQARLLEDARRDVTSVGSVQIGTLQSLEQIGIKVGRDAENKLVYELPKLLEGDK